MERSTEISQGDGETGSILLFTDRAAHGSPFVAERIRKTSPSPRLPVNFSLSSLGVVAALLWAAPAGAQPARSHWSMPDGAALVRLLGPRATDAVPVPGAASREIRGRVLLPAGVRASDVGLRELVPGLARLSGSPA